MGNNKNQHYLPQFYLRGFEAQDITAKHVWVYRAPPKNVSGTYKRTHPSSWQKQSIRNTASGPYRHSNLQSNGTYDHRIDKAFDVLEDGVSPAVEKIRRGNSLNDEDRQLFALFVMMMYLRVPNRTDSTLKFMNDVEEIRHALYKQYWGGSDNPDVRVAYQHRYPEARPFKTTLPEALEVMMEPFLSATSILLQMNWVFRRVKNGRTFITSDDPVTIHDRFQTHWQFGGGLRCPGTIVQMPVSAEVDFWASWDEISSESWMTIDDDEAEGANIMCAAKARHLLISSTPSFPGSHLHLNTFYTGVNF